MANVCKIPGSDSRQILGVRKCKRIIRSLFPFLCIYTASYRRFKISEFLSCYKDDFDFYFNFFQDESGLFLFVSIYGAYHGYFNTFYFHLNSDFEPDWEGQKSLYDRMSHMFDADSNFYYEYLLRIK